jgi:hypothetical protein
VAGGNGDVLLIVSAEFTGSVKLPDAVALDESVTVTGKDTEVTPVGGVPERKPAALSDSQVGNPVAAQVYPPLPPEAVKLSE